MAIPVLIAAALLTAVTLVLIFAEVSKSARTALLAIDLVLWAFFALDFLVRFVLTPYKRRFARTEWLDLLLVVVPIFQPLRLVGAFLRLARLSAALDRTTRGAKLLMGRHVTSPYRPMTVTSWWQTTCRIRWCCWMRSI